MSERKFALVDFTYMNREGSLRLYEAGHTYTFTRAVAHAATKRELVAKQRPARWDAAEHVPAVGVADRGRGGRGGGRTQGSAAARVGGGRSRSVILESCIRTDTRNRQAGGTSIGFNSIGREPPFRGSGWSPSIALTTTLRADSASSACCAIMSRHSATIWSASCITFSCL
jgi:hypothetical protein